MLRSLSCRRLLGARPPRRIGAGLALTAIAALVSSVLGTPADAAPLGARTGPVVAPAAVTDVCDQRPRAGHVACFAERLERRSGASAGSTRIAATAAPSGYGPAQLQSAYAIAAAAESYGAGRRVYIVDAYDDPRAEADLQVYRAKFGLPRCTTANGCFRKLNQNGATAPMPSADAGWSSEIALDLDMVSAACPRCGITLMEANDTGIGMFTAVRRATALGAKFVSMSWGMSEGSWAPTLDADYFAAAGVVYTAAAGDAGFADGASYPATSPRVVAVGGTSLFPAANARGWSEQVWRQTNSLATGSGCSTHETKPSWQSAGVPASVCRGRAESDISAVADPRTGVAMYTTYGGSGWAVYGGTSAAAPLVAAMYALAGPPAASAQPAAALYGRAAFLHDVTTGSNGVCGGSAICVARPGWDGPTGLGTPNGIGAFTPAATPRNQIVVRSPGARSVRLGARVRIAVAVTDSGSLRPTVRATGLPRGLRVSGGVVVGAPKAKGRYHVSITASDSTGGTGRATFRLTVF